MGRAIEKIEAPPRVPGHDPGPGHGQGQGQKQARGQARARLRMAIGIEPSGPASVRRASVRIRAASPLDASSLAALRRQAEEVHARLLPDYFRVATDTGPAVPLALSRGPAGAGAVTLVAEGNRGRNHPVLGYVTLRLVEAPRDPAITPRRRTHVETIVVDEEHRARGIGTALMRAAAAWASAHAAAEMVLTVWSENRAAEALYRRLGYRPIAHVLRLQIDA